MVNGAKDRVVPTESVRGLVDRLKTQKGIVIDHQTVPDANHFFEGRMDGLMEVVDAYLDKRLGKGKKRKDSAA
jgi:alpha/beta superfamily hydrolase